MPEGEARRHGGGSGSGGSRRRARRRAGPGGGGEAGSVRERGREQGRGRGRSAPHGARRHLRSERRHRARARTPTTLPSARPPRCTTGRPGGLKATATRGGRAGKALWDRRVRAAPQPRRGNRTAALSAVSSLEHLRGRWLLRGSDV